MTKKKSGIVAGSIADLVGQYLHKHGPQHEADLYLVIDFGCAACKRSQRIEGAIRDGWIVLDGDRLACGAAARAHYSEMENDEANGFRLVGEKATSRDQGNVFDRPALSRKHIPNARGMREDVPAWSVREAGFCMKTVSGGEQ
jgi:hypothetical protein